jgi:hypothetical protein
MNPNIPKTNSFIGLFLILTISLLMICCKSEPEFSVIGSWNVDEVADWRENSETGEMVGVKDVIVNAGTIVFLEGNTGLFIEDDDHDEDSLRWSLSGNILFMALHDNGQNWNIEEKSDTKMKIARQGSSIDNPVNKMEISLRKLK